MKDICTAFLIAVDKTDLRDCGYVLYQMVLINHFVA